MKRLLLFVALILTLMTIPAFPQDIGVRLAMVNIPSDLVRPLLPGFLQETGIHAKIVYTGNDPFTEARAGRADLVISHYGHEGVEAFVTGGWGLWPHTVFANQMVLLGPAADPAGVRGIYDAAEAFRHIAASKSRFLSNNSAGAKYLEKILWISADVRDKGDWYMDLKSQGPQAMHQAAARGAYMLWGLPPFLRQKRHGRFDLEPLVVQDPILQRIMVSIVVNPAKVPSANSAGARAFQNYLLAPATQARIRKFRYPGFAFQAWWPAGRHNNAHD